MAETEDDWFPEGNHECAQPMGLNMHLGAEGAMSIGRAQDPEGVKTIVINYNTTAGAVATMVKRRF